MLTKEALERVPFPFIVYSLTSGLLLMYLSPLRILLPPHIQHPFSLDSPDILGVFLVVAICSFSLGAVMYLFFPLIIGNGGLNERLSVKVLRRKKRQPRDPSCELVQDERPEFVEWLRTTRVTSQWDFLLTERMIICAFITSCEIAFFADLPYFVRSIFICIFSRARFCDPLWPIYTALSLFLAVSFIWFDKKHFRDWLHEFQEKVIRDFHTSSRMSIDRLKDQRVRLVSRLSANHISEDVYKEASRIIEDRIRELQDRKSEG